MILLAAVWVLSLFLPTVAQGDNHWGTGWNVLVLGWMGIIYGGVEWLANPLLFLVLAALYQPRREPGLLACFAILLGILFAVSIARTEMVDNEGGVANPITARFSGYYLWIFAIAAGSSLGLIGEFRPKWLGFIDRAAIKD